MKTIRFYVWMLLAALAGVAFTACEDDKPDPKIIDPLLESHFDIWVSIGENAGMGSAGTLLVQNMKSLDAKEQINFVNTGADVTAKLYQESIIKGAYYYQVPKEQNRFGKYQIVGNKVRVIKEFSFQKNTLKDRRYTHAWIDDHTLVLMAANGKADKVIWIKVNTDQMNIVAEGELKLPKLPGKAGKPGKFSTSGIASFRKSDGKILYSYLDNNDKVRFYMAFINPADMSVEKTVMEDRAEFMAGTAYGELLQSKSFFTPEGDYYLACNSVLKGATSNTQQYGSLLRIKKGETDFDKSYKGYNYPKGKIVTVDYLGNEKALLYIQDPEYTKAKGWGDDYNCYYAVLDLKTDKVEEIKHDGKVLPYSSGTFSQRSIVLGDKAYIGVNPENELPCVYIYNIKTGEVTKGLTIAKGYLFGRIVALKDK